MLNPRDVQVQLNPYTGCSTINNIVVSPFCGAVGVWLVLLEDKHNNGGGHTITKADSFLSSHMSSTYSDILICINTYLPNNSQPYKIVKTFSSKLFCILFSTQ